MYLISHKDSRREGRGRSQAHGKNCGEGGWGEREDAVGGGGEGKREGGWERGGGGGRDIGGLGRG